MAKSVNHQLQFFIKLTEIIGRTFSDLQQLLTTQLRRQQSEIENSLPNGSSQNHPLPNGLLKPKQTWVVPNLAKNGGEDQKNQINASSQPKPQQKNHCRLNKSKLIKKSRLKIHQLKVNKKVRQVKQKIRGRRRRIKKKQMQQGKPMPPLNAFMLFLKQKKHEIMAKKPELSPSQVSIYASTIWNAFGQAQKQQYIEMYKKNHEVYIEQLKRYRAQEKPAPKQKQTEKQQNYGDNIKIRTEEKLKINLRSNVRHRIKKRNGSTNQVISIDSEQLHDQQENEGKNLVN